MEPSRANAAIASPELRARVDSIIAERATRRQRLLAWQRHRTPDATTSEDEWKQYLDPMEFDVIRQKGTERRGGEYDGFFPPAHEGHFACRGCGRPVYSAAAKFKSGCGWPAFDKCFKNAVAVREDRTAEPMRIEITCAGCDGHLGHVFAGERMTPTNERHCVNSISMLYVESMAVACSSDTAAWSNGTSMPPPLAEETVCTMRNLAKIRTAP